MKTIGLIGGMSPVSTVIYYQAINRAVNRRLGGHASAKLLIHSVNFAETHALQLAGAWDELGDALARAGLGLEHAGAELIILATNTMHKCAPAIEAAIEAPFLHIADATAAALKSAGLSRPALLGTRYTMEETFYTGRLIERHGIETIVPAADERDEIHRVIFDELVHGEIREASRSVYLAIADRLIAAGADSLILGCTEIGLLLTAENAPAPVYDTALIHADSAAEWALAHG